MKLHLPVILRKALLATFATVSYLTVTSVPASALDLLLPIGFLAETTQVVYTNTTIGNLTGLPPGLLPSINYVISSPAASGSQFGTTNIHADGGFRIDHDVTNIQASSITNLGRLQLDYNSSLNVVGSVIAHNTVGYVNTGFVQLQSGATLTVGGNFMSDANTSIAGTLTATTGTIVLAGQDNNLLNGTLSAGSALNVTNAILGNTTLTSQGSMTLAGTLLVYGNNTITAAGTLTLNGDLDTPGGSISAQSVQVNSKVYLRSTDLTATITNIAAGTGELTFNGGTNHTIGTVVNAGTLALVNAAEATAISVTNTGHVRIDEGTVLHAQMLVSSGTGTTDIEGTLTLSGALSLGGVSNDLGTAVVTASQITVNGATNSLDQAHLTSASTITINNGDLAETTLTANGGNITLSGVLTSYGSNVITTTGDLLLNSDYSSINDTITAQALKVNAVVELTTSSVTVGQTDIAVAPASLTLSGGDGCHLGTVTNNGTLILTAGTTAQAGVVTTNGLLNIQSTAILNTGNVVSNGTTVITGTLSATGNVTLGGTNNNLDNGTVEATGTLTVNGTANSLSQAHLQAGSLLSVSNATFATSTLKSDTDIILSGTLASYGTNTFDAAGTLTFNGGFNSIDDTLTSHILNVNANVYLINGSITTDETHVSLGSGDLTLVNGTNYHLGNVTNAGSLAVRNEGTIAFAGTVLNTGSLTVGYGSTLHTGSVTSNSGTSHTEITGTLTAEGSITLGGTGNALASGTISAGTTLDIVNAGLGNTTLSSGGNMTLGGTITDWGGNTVTAGGNLNISAGASVDLIGESHVSVGADLVVEGGVTVGGVLQVTGGTQITGEGSLVLNETNDNSNLGVSVTVNGNGSLLVENNTSVGVHVVVSGDVTISDSGKACIINTTYNVDGGNGTITVNDQGKLCIINSTVNGNVVTTNPNAENSTSVYLDNAHISKNLTVVGGDLYLSHDNTVGGTLTISDQVTVNVNCDEGVNGTLTVVGGTLIKPDASLTVNSDSHFISNVTMTGGSLTINGNGDELAPSFRGDITFAGTVGDENSRTVTVNGDHTQTGSIYVDNDGTVNVTEGGTMDLQGNLTFHEGADPSAVLTINDGTTGTLEISSSNTGFRNDINLAGGTLQIDNANEAIGQEGTLHVTGQDVVLLVTAEDSHIGKLINTTGSGNGLTIDTQEDLTLTGAVIMDNADTLTKTGDALLTLAHEGSSSNIGILDQQEGDILMSGTDYSVAHLNVDPGLTFTSEGGNTFSGVTAGPESIVNLEGTNGADTLKGDVTLNGATLNADGTEVDIDNLDVLTVEGTSGTGNLTDVSGAIGATTVDVGSTLNITGSTLSGDTLTTGGTTTIEDSTLTLADTYVTGGVLTLKDDIALGGNVSVEQGVFHIEGDGVTLSSNGTLSFDPDADSTTDPDSRVIWISSDLDYAGHLAVNANGTIDVDAGKTMDVNGTFTGTASLDKTGDGTLNFHGTSGYSGTIHLSEGTIGATASNAFGSTSTLSIDGDNVVVNTGTAGGAPVTFDAGLTVAGDHPFVINTLSDTTWNGVLAGTEGTLNKTGAATLNLTNTSSQDFTTAISLQQGGLAVNGAIGSNVDMAAGTVLSGAGVTTGTVTALHDNTVIEIGKAGVPGDIATLTIGGLKATNAVIDSTGVHKTGTTIVFDVNLNNGTSDLLKITGPADLNSAALQLRNADSQAKVKDNTRFHLIESEGLLSQAHPIVLHNLDLMNVRLEQLTNGKDVDVVLSLNHKGADKTDNQTNISNTIDNIDRGGFATDDLAQLIDSFNYTRSEAEARKALEDAGGTRLTTTMASMLAGNHDHLRQLRGSMGTGVASSTLVRDGKRSWLEAPEKTTIWVDGVYAYNKLNSDGNAPGYTRNSWGGLLGVEHMVRPDSLVLGVSVGYDYSKTEVQGLKDDADNWYIDLYGKWKSGNWNSRASIGMGYHDFTNNRFVGVADRFARHGHGSTNGYSLNLAYELAYTFQMDRNSTLEPLFMVESTAGWIDGYTESGEIGNAGLRVEDQDAWSTILGLGARYTWNFTWVANAPQARFETTAMATVDVGDRSNTVTASYIGAPGFTYNMDSAKRERLGALLGAALVVPMTSSFSAFAGSTLEFHDGSRDLTANVGVRYSF